MQLKRVIDPFGEVNVYPADAGKVRVTATILMEPRREGTQTGIALDGSGSMSELYGVNTGGGVVSPLFQKPKPAVNQITPVAQNLCEYLARRIDADGGTTVIYWAVGPGGSQVEVVGDLTAEMASQTVFGPPKQFGTGTQLLPALKYFVERFADAPWGFYVFITDGELHDLNEVKEYTIELARAIEAGRRRPLKCVLIGVGSSVNEQQMRELDDLDTGTSVDIWDHKLAEELRELQQIFAEVVDRNARVADNGKILAPDGSVLRDYPRGLPAMLEFEAPATAEYFTLSTSGARVHQMLSDSAIPPPPRIRPIAPEEISLTSPAPPAPPIPEVKPVAPPPKEPLDPDVGLVDFKFDREPVGLDLQPEEYKREG